MAKVVDLSDHRARARPKPEDLAKPIGERSPEFWRWAQDMVEGIVEELEKEKKDA